ncbi:hypothetical protein GMO_28320 [Gluconobacter morbifer G707]|uniref:Uncharacterized protein n=1 Tax=Gluconobacter morbifer G707 TaxID=1088869 RepID=G6XMW4_9PROT|nr:hypothetical protein GMO_28320 [Gluconobacter morbifer G707]
MPPELRRHGSSAGAPQPVQAIVSAGSPSSQCMLQRRQVVGSCVSVQRIGGRPRGVGT